MRQSADVVILGGGVIGCAIAYYLSKQQVDVLVVERGEIGVQDSGQASPVAAGIFSLLKPFAKMDAYVDLLLASRTLFPSLVAEIQPISGIDVEYTPTSTLRTSRKASPRTTERLQHWTTQRLAEGLHVQMLSNEEVHDLEPLLSSEIVAATLIAQEGQVRASRYINALQRAAMNNGAIFQEQTEVVDIEYQEKRIRGIVTAHGEHITCKQLVLASGAWAADCGKWLDLTLPVIPQKGQLLALRQPSDPIHHIIIGYGIYLAPKEDNTIIVGATQEEVGFDARVTVEGMQTLLQAAVSLVPALRQCEIGHMWAGLRPKTPDNNPILGRVQGCDNLILAVGHNSFGVLLSAITGQTIAELIMTEQIPKLIQPFALERFQ